MASSHSRFIHLSWQVSQAGLLLLLLISSHGVLRGDAKIAPQPQMLRWSDPATWALLDTPPPAAGAVVTIPQGRQVLLDEDTPPLKGILVEGELHVDRRPVALIADYVIVTGLMQIGTLEEPFAQRVVITLTQDYTDRDESVGPCGTKVLCAAGGRLNFHGAVSGPTWTRLADGNTATVGSTSIRVEEPVDWRPGDEIVIVSTDFNPYQAERRVITQLSEDRQSLQFEVPLEYMHWGEIMEYAGRPVDQRAEVMHLSRNIVIQGDERSTEDGMGGHVMILSKHFDAISTAAAEPEDWMRLWQDPAYANRTQDLSQISGVELSRMGQTGRMGRYPLHFHMFGGARGAYVKDSSVHDSFQRCYVVHGTFGVRLENNVAYESIGHCYFLESFIEKDNTLVGNIGAVMRYFPSESQRLIESDRNPSIFWVSFPTNHLIGNVAAGTEGVGIWIDLRDTGGSAHNEFAKEPMGEMRDNVVHSTALGSYKASYATGNPRVDGGIGFMYEGGIGPIENLTAYKNVFNFWADESSDFEIVNSTFADAHTSIWQRRDGSFNSLFVAHTANIGQPTTPAEIEAGRTIPQFSRSHVNLISAIMGWYSKSFSINNTFIGYTSDDHFERGVASIGGLSFDAPIFFEGSTMIDSDPFVPPPLPTRGRGSSVSQGSVIIDFDGTLTGAGAYREVRIGPSILTDEAAGCRPIDMKFKRPIFSCDSRSKRFDSFEDRRVTVGGESYSGSQANSRYVLVGQVYEMEGSPGSQYTTREGYRGEYIILKFSDVDEPPPVTPRTRRDRVAEAQSLAEIMSEETSRLEHVWYYDGEARALWLRLVTGDKANAYGEKNVQDGVRQPFSMHYGVRIGDDNRDKRRRRRSQRQ